MKKMTFLFLMLLISSLSWSAPKGKSAKDSKKEGKMTLKADLDYNPKLLTLSVPNIKKKNNFTINLEIVNNSTVERMAKVVFYEYYPNENGINILKMSKANQKRPDLSITDYIKYNREPFLVKAKSKMIYKVDLNLPKDLKGTKYAYYTVEEVPMINYVETRKVSEGKKSAIAMALSYFSPLVVDIANSGEKKVELRIKYFPDHKLVSVMAKNIGDHYIRVPVINVVLLNEKNQFVDKLTLNIATDEIKSLHPTCHLPFISRLTKGLKPGKYRAVVALTGDEGLFVHSQEMELIVPLAGKTTENKKNSK